MIIYTALYCDGYESSYVTLSLHKTKEGAEKAIAFSKKEAMDEWEKMYGDEDDETKKQYPWNFAKWWDIGEMELQD